MSESTTADPPPSLFPDTRWDLLERLRNGLEPEQAEAMELLCREYRGPVCAWLRARFPDQDVEDIAHDFFLHRAIRLGLFLKADAGKGKLRSLIITALNCHAKTYLRRKVYSERRGGQATHVPLDSPTFNEAEDVIHNEGEDENRDPSNRIDLELASEIQGIILRQLESEYRKSGEAKAKLFEALSWRILDTSRDDYTGNLKALNLPPDAVRIALHRMRKRYHDLVALVRETISDKI